MAMTTDEVMEHCATELPEHYHVGIYIEKGYGCVTWTGPSDVTRKIEIDDGDMTSAILQALAACHKENEESK